MLHTRQISPEKAKLCPMSPSVAWGGGCPAVSCSLHWPQAAAGLSWTEGSSLSASNIDDSIRCRYNRLDGENTATTLGLSYGISMISLLRALCFFSLVLIAGNGRVALAHRPNIITIFIDDMGWSDLSCFGGSAVKTRNIDQLAAEGLKFTSFYVNAPICSPSRVALTTGIYPQRLRITSYLADRQANEQRGIAHWLDPETTVLARELKHSGYKTGHFGKWHMGGQRDVGEAPLISEFGFERSLTNFEGLGPRVLPLLDAYDGGQPRKYHLGSADLGRGSIRWVDRSATTQTYVDEALKFILEAQQAEKPFYLNLWPDDVHSPFFPPQVLRKQTDGSKRSRYHAVLEALDHQLAPLFDLVRTERNLRDNTLILLASDNGPEPGAGSSSPLRGAKTMLYEGGVRSPLIVWGPGLLASEAIGATNESSVFCALDINRSLYAISHTPLPEEVQLDGENLAGTLLGKGKQSRQAPIFWRRPPDRPGTKADPNPDLAMRDGKWKFYVNYDGSNPQLYDVCKDQSESNNLAATNLDLANQFEAALLKWNTGLPADAGDPHFSEGRVTDALPNNQFVNPIAEGADPWVIRDPNAERYLWCLSERNHAIAIHVGEHLTSLGQKHIVWRAPDSGPNSREVWAPELHYLDGRWHVYFAASDGKNENHLAWVLRSESGDPLGPYQLHGPLATGEGEDGRSPNVWAIDMTVMEHQGKRYAIWSGWDAPGTDRQYLYIAAMKSPHELAGRRVRICSNDDYLWERVEPQLTERGLNEAPQVLQVAGRTFVMYSCGASWLPTYKLGLLELTGHDPLDPTSWEKHAEPVFSSTVKTFGVGHSCFVPSQNGAEWWHVYHAKRDRDPGWRRAIFVQPMQLNKEGFPEFGAPVDPGVPLQRPSGEDSTALELPYHCSLRSEVLPAEWSYYGHHDFVKFTSQGFGLGRASHEAVNEYRSGEKVILNRHLSNNLSIEVSMDFQENSAARDAGILFRTSAPSIGYDAQRGYFAGVIPQSDRIILGKTDGRSWFELARASSKIDVSRPLRLRVDVIKDEIGVSVDGKRFLTVKDTTYSQGSAGLRVVDTHAIFSEFQISPLKSMQVGSK